MNTKQTADKWNCKPRWVSDRCNENMIPSATKIRGKWDIPEDAEKPPCAVGKAVSILENLQEIISGNKVYLFSPSSRENSEKVIRYLSREGFVSQIKDTDEIDAVVQQITITKRGVELIAHAKKVSVEEVQRQFKITAGVHMGIVNASVEYNASKKVN